MKIEMRWLERKTGKTIINENGWYDAEVETVLQYRYEYDPPHSPYPQKWWTDWLDVPTVREEDETGK